MAITNAHMILCAWERRVERGREREKERCWERNVEREKEKKNLHRGDIGRERMGEKIENNGVNRTEERERDRQTETETERQREGIIWPKLLSLDIVIIYLYMYYISCTLFYSKKW